MSEALPFFPAAREHAALADELAEPLDAALRSGRWLAGERVARFEDELAAVVGRAHVAGCGSGTDALWLALRALGVGAGDEVVVADLSFVATATAVVRAGATPVFADVDEDGLLDLAAARAACGPRTAAIVAVPLFGRAFDPVALEALAAQAGVPLVEDAAQALGASRAGRPCGAFGAVSCLSFDPTKPLSAPGSGGAVATDDPQVDAAVRRLRRHGRDADGLVVELGVNSQLPTVAATVLSRKLAHLDAWRERRAGGATRLAAAARTRADLEHVPDEPPDGRHAWSKFVLRARDRDALAASLERAGVPTAVHYPRPLSAHPLLAREGRRADDGARARHHCATALTLPLHAFLTDGELDRVEEAVATA